MLWGELAKPRKGKRTCRLSLDKGGAGSQKGGKGRFFSALTEEPFSRRGKEEGSLSLYQRGFSRKRLTRKGIFPTLTAREFFSKTP